MFDPTLNALHSRSNSAVARKGAIMPMFAFIMPVLLVLCGFAINLAYMQKVTTELKVATDAAAHAGGRAMSIHQTTDAAIAQAEITAQTNTVGGKIICVSSDGDESDEDHLDVRFGLSIRGDNGYGMYEFEEVSKSDVDNGTRRATSVAVVSQVDLPMVFKIMNYEYLGGNLSSFTARRRSIATQVDRDIALVLDRSGSMLYYKDEEELTDTLYDLYQTYDTETTPGYWKYGYYRQRSDGSWSWKGYWRPEDANSSWVQRYSWQKYYVDPVTTSERRISWSEYQDATDWLYDRTYTNNVIYQLERWENSNHTLGDTFSSSESNELTTEMSQYTRDWKYSSGAPRHSRWYFLDLGVTAFLDILEITDQEELVSLVTFNNTARVDYALQETYGDIRSTVSEIVPYGGTAIGDGMLDGLPPIVDGEAARPFAAKTIVVLTDGENNAGEDPGDAVAEIIEDHLVTIHTVTFSKGADQDAMKSVAEAGYGRHYHAEDGDELVEIFEEIANNLPTILTE